MAHPQSSQGYPTVQSEQSDAADMPLNDDNHGPGHIPQSVLHELSKLQSDSISRMQALHREQIQRIEDSVVRGLQGVADARVPKVAREYLHAILVHLDEFKAILQDQSSEHRLQQINNELSQVRGTIQRDLDMFGTSLSDSLAEMQGVVRNSAQQINLVMQESVRELSSLVAAELLTFGNTLSSNQESINRTISEYQKQSDTASHRHRAFESKMEARLTSLEQIMQAQHSEVVVLLKQLSTPTSHHGSRLRDLQTQGRMPAPATRENELLRRPTEQKRTRAQSLTDDSDSESDIGSHPWHLSASEDSAMPRSARSIRSDRNVKIPAFTGKESWNVWYTRFRDISKRRGWSEEKKLDELLPKLQGSAGEFVYDQLPSKVRQNYSALTRELKNRFRKVVNPKTYSTKFAASNQKPNQSVEDYAAELKMLYDKAFPTRDRRTRNEDLLRRFLNGLADKDAKFQVEYVKNPADIDTAVDEVVNFMEVRNLQNKPVRSVQPAPDSSASDASETEEQINKVWKPPNKNTNDAQRNRPPVPNENEQSKLADDFKKLTMEATELKQEIQRLKEAKQTMQPIPQQGSGNSETQYTTPNAARRNRPYWPRNPNYQGYYSGNYPDHWQTAPPFYSSHTQNMSAPMPQSYPAQVHHLPAMSSPETRQQQPSHQQVAQDAQNAAVSGNGQGPPQ